MMQFALPKIGTTFMHLFQRFPGLFGHNIKESIFTELDIKELLSSTEYADAMNNLQQKDWHQSKK